MILLAAPALVLSMLLLTAWFFMLVMGSLAHLTGLTLSLWESLMVVAAVRLLINPVKVDFRANSK